MFYGIDSTYIYMVLPAIIFAMWAQAQVQGTYNRYSKLMARRGYSGADVARIILDRNQLNDIQIEHINGKLSDHYDPKDKVIRLSDAVYSNSSVAAIGVAAHEVGHAIQHSEGYVPLKLRNAIIPVTGFASTLSIPLILIGLFLNYSYLIYFGIIFFAFAVAVQIVTLPVEFNASARALNILESSGILSDDEEILGAKKVLRAAAMTYVAATVVALMQLLRLLILFGGRRRD